MLLMLTSKAASSAQVMRSPIEAFPYEVGTSWVWFETRDARDFRETWSAPFFIIFLYCLDEEGGGGIAIITGFIIADDDNGDDLFP